MPAEIAQMHLKPYNFCAFNPTNDVPPSNQAFNRSVLYEDSQEIVSEAQAGSKKGGCCNTNYAG